MSGCQDCQDVRMSGCEDVRMSGCEDVDVSHPYTTIPYIPTSPTSLHPTSHLPTSLHSYVPQNILASPKSSSDSPCHQRAQQVHTAVRVAPFVVVPRQDLDEVAIHHLGRRR